MANKPKVIKIKDKYAVVKKGIFLNKYLDLISTRNRSFWWFRLSSHFTDCLTEDRNYAEEKLYEYLKWERIESMREWEELI